MDDFKIQVYTFLQGIYQDVYELTKSINPWIASVCFAVGFVLIILADKRFSKKLSIPFSVVAALYLTFLLSLTILGREPDKQSSFDKLFYTYQQALSGDEGMAFDILFNIILYIPVGILISRYKNNLADMIFILSLTTVIEFVQLITSKGIFEISDIINNFVGGLIGLLIARMAAKLFQCIKKRKGGRVERAE